MTQNLTAEPESIMLEVTFSLWGMVKESQSPSFAALPTESFALPSSPVILELPKPSIPISTPRKG
jgi:hypothetical protein